MANPIGFSKQFDILKCDDAALSSLGLNDDALSSSRYIIIKREKERKREERKVKVKSVMHSTIYESFGLQT